MESPSSPVIDDVVSLSVLSHLLYHPSFPSGKLRRPDLLLLCFSGISELVLTLLRSFSSGCL